MWFPTHFRGQEILWLNCVLIELIIYMPQVLHHRHHRQLEQTTHTTIVPHPEELVRSEV